ncbi:hypothetical protein ACFXTI_005746 [Malus domestica]
MTSNTLKLLFVCDFLVNFVCPYIVDQVHDPPEKELLDPAIKGTLNVLTAAKQAGVSRVVLTSSISAITPSPSWPSVTAKGEEAAWEFAKEKGWMSCGESGTVMGAVMSRSLNASMLMLLRILTVKGWISRFINLLVHSRLPWRNFTNFLGDIVSCL